MSTKNRKTRNPQPALETLEEGASPEPGPHALAMPQRQKMRENDVENGFFRLTRRQQAALPVVAFAPSITQAALDSGVPQSTLYRWLNDPAFREALTSFHQESAELAREIFQSQTLQAACVFAELMREGDPALRLRAARYSTSLAIRIRDSEQLATELRDIKEALNLIKD